MQFTTDGYEDMELSTQLIIREALSRGYRVDVLDREDNFIRITNRRRSEIIKQATRTRKDSYISPLIMENKAVTKSLLTEAGIAVPSGEALVGMEALQEAFTRWENRPFVLKPNSTNFGKGVMLFPSGADRGAFTEAAAQALREDRKVLLEELVPGKEYRFLVIGGRVRAVLHRIPANVKGDGVLTVAELVDRKNENPLRGQGYHSPLEKIRKGEEERLYLQRWGWSWASVPPRGEVVYLRENSNISTGGDSIDVTETVHPGYKDIAAAASQVLGAGIVGADIIIQDAFQKPSGDNYSVIEMNFNPALHIHDYPLIGENRRVESFVLDLLERD